MGGTVDPETGEVIWTMRVPLDQQLAFYRSHAPRAIAELRSTALEHIDWTFDRHGEPVSAIFEVACPCGCTLFWPTSAADEDDELAPPVTIECDACETAFDVFDANKHGWDAVMCGDHGD